MSDHIWDFVGHEQILVGQWPMTDSYLQPCNSVLFVQVSRKKRTSETAEILLSVVLMQSMGPH